MAVKGCGGFGTPTVLVLLRSKERISKATNYTKDDGCAKAPILINYNLFYISKQLNFHVIYMSCAKTTKQFMYKCTNCRKFIKEKKDVANKYLLVYNYSIEWYRKFEYVPGFERIARFLKSSCI